MTSTNYSQKDNRLDESSPATKFMQALAKGDTKNAENAFENMVSGKLERRIKEVVSKETRVRK